MNTPSNGTPPNGTPSTTGLGRALVIATGIAIALAITGAIIVSGAPGQQRLQRLDERRLVDLSQLAMAVRRHAFHHGGMPADLATATTAPGLDIVVADPVTGAPYVYERLDDARFRLCATFATDTADLPGHTRPSGGDDWAHPAGFHCFDLKADPKLSNPR
jgi:hypothetical protein